MTEQERLKKIEKILEPAIRFIEQEYGENINLTLKLEFSKIWIPKISLEVESDRFHRGTK